ncbi:MAG: HTH domain-containing protein, partial [Sulfobacillus thermotolerans]|nr:HTH domain-containing protein [Sulfobacillus thermotolerans]
MTGSERRAWLKAHLNGTTPIAGHELSQTLGVSRQVVVQDIALLRAEGHPIISTPRGYMIWEKPSGSIRQVLAVKHSDDPHIVRQELLTLVSHHVTVLNVIVAHPLYGELVGNLNLTSS